MLLQAGLFAAAGDGRCCTYVIYSMLPPDFDPAAHSNQAALKLWQCVAAEAAAAASHRPNGQAAPSHKYRDKCKLIMKLANFEAVKEMLNGVEQKFVSKYDGKPVLTRPQHAFYRGRNHLEVDIDMHNWSYLPRKGLDMFRSRTKHAVMDFALLVEGQCREELPEQLLTCCRVHHPDAMPPDEQQDYHRFVAVAEGAAAAPAAPEGAGAPSL